MENVRNRRRIDLLSTGKQIRKFAAQPTFKSTRTFHADLVALERYKPIVMLNKPIFIGLCVLELSKVGVSDFDSITDYSITDYCINFCRHCMTDIVV